MIARHVTDLFPTQTSRFDLAQAARRGVIAPLRCVRISPGVGVRTIAKVPLRRGEVDTEFDQDELAKLLDQQPFNVAVANLYKTRFNGVPGVVYAAGVRHAYNLAEAFRAEGIKAQAVSGETPKRELVEILARYERGDIDVLINAQLLAEGWNSPRATVCVHLAPTASKRIYQQRVGRVTRRHPGKEAGLVVDFVHPATKHDDPVVTLHSLLDRDVYRGGAIVVGPVRRGRGRRMRVERRVLPVCAEEERRFAVFERELWRIAVEHLDYGEQHVWAALAGARVAPNGWRRARAMLHFDRTGELKSRFLITAVQRNKNPQLRLRALTDIAALRDPDAFDTAIDIIGGWPREERKEATKIMLRALVERRIGRRDQANAWIWRLAEYTRDVHEEYAVQRWPETKRLLGLLVNSAGGAHARNARRLIHAARKQDRRLAAALLAAALAHTPEAEEALRGARTRMARKPPALARELLRNFPKRRARNARRRRKGAKGVSQRTPGPSSTTGWHPQPRSAWPSELGGRSRTEAPTERSRQPAMTARERREREDPGEPAPVRVGLTARHRASADRLQVDLARVERRAPAVGERDHEAPGAVDALRAPAPARPGDLPPAQRVTRAPGLERPSLRVLEPPLERGQQPLRTGSMSSAESPSVAAGSARGSPGPDSRSSGGSCSSWTATFSPIPSTAQPSCGLPSMRIPASLASRAPPDCGRPAGSGCEAITTSFGHLIRASSPATSQTATAAISGSSGGGERSTSDISSELPARRRPAPAPGVRARRSARRPSRAFRAARPRSPARARGRSSSRCRRRCTRGRPSGDAAAGRAPRRSRRAHEQLLVALHPRCSAAEPRLTASAAICRASS